LLFRQSERRTDVVCDSVTAGGEREREFEFGDFGSPTGMDRRANLVQSVLRNHGESVIKYPNGEVAWKLSFQRVSSIKSNRNRGKSNLTNRTRESEANLTTIESLESLESTRPNSQRRLASARSWPSFAGSQAKLVGSSVPSRDDG
jgi:hypothetical protein